MHRSGPQLENVDALTAGVFHALGRIMHLNRLVMLRTAALRGIQPREVFALVFLDGHDDITQSELAELLNLSHPRVSMILRALEQSGAVERRPDETDRRVTRVFITEQGRQRAKEQRVVISEYVDRTIGALSEGDRRELERGLNKLADQISAVLVEAQDGGSQAEDMRTR